MVNSGVIGRSMEEMIVIVGIIVNGLEDEKYHCIFELLVVGNIVRLEA